MARARFVLGKRKEYASTVKQRMEFVIPKTGVFVRRLEDG